MKGIILSVFHVLKIERKLHPNTVFIIDDYDKYYIYDKDCYIIYKIFNFDIHGKKNIFITNRIKYLPYLLNKLNEEKIDYKVLCKRHGYDINSEHHFLDNNYCKVLKNGKLRYQRTKRLNQIYCKLNYFLKNDSKELVEILNEIEGIVYV